MRRAMLGASALVVSLAISDRALPLPLSAPHVEALAIAGSSIQRTAYTCIRWWEWRGARWVRTCWPAGYDPCGNAPGCSPPTSHRPYWHGWGWTYPDLPW